MKMPPVEVPNLRGRVLVFLVPALLLGLLCLLYVGLERSRTGFDQDEARALRLLRGLTAISAELGLEQPRPLQEMVQRLTSAGRPVTGLWIITERQVGAFEFQRARTYVVHSDPALAGRPLDKDEVRDKAAADISKDVETRFGKYAQERPHLTYVVNASDDRGTSFSAAGPIVREGKIIGTLGLSLAAERPAIPLPWLTVLLLVLTASALMALVFKLVPQEKVAAVVATVVLVATTYSLFRVASETIRETEAYASTRSMIDAVALYQAMPQAVRPDTLVDAFGQVQGPGRAVTLLYGARAGQVGPGELLALTPQQAEWPFVGAVVNRAKAALGLSPLADNSYLQQIGGRLSWTFVPLILLFFLGFIGYLQQFGRMLRTHAFAYAYAAPAMLGMALFVFFPFVCGFLFSFFERVTGDDLAGTVRMFDINFIWMGFQNFFDILASREYSITHPLNFYFTLSVTILWTVSNVALHVAIGLALALILKNPWVKLKGIYRVLLIVPWAVPNYITALIWKGLFDVEYGTINYVLVALGLGKVGWWSGFWTAFAANLTTNVWLGFPFMMVICLGALQSIPADLYEAAEVDGASRWQQLRTITLPLLKPALFPAIILGCIWTFNMFNIIYLVSGGAPDHRTDILITQAYRFAFEAGRYGYAAAYAVIIFVILLVYGTLTNRVTKASEGAFD